MYLWEFNYAIQKVLDYKKKLKKPIRFLEFKKLIEQNSDFPKFDPIIFKYFGEELHLINFSMKSNNEFSDNFYIEIIDDGVRFYNLRNESNQKSLTNGQRDFILEKFINSVLLDDLLKMVVLNGEEYVIKRNFINNYQKFLISLLKNELQIIEDCNNDDFFFFSKRFYPLINERYKKMEKKKKRRITEKELLEKLNQQRIIGREGEKIVFEYEKKRVKALFPDFKDKVKPLYEEFVNAGYDIESINSDGTKRYIEVKTSNKPSREFFISRNELQVAEEKKEDFWIYFVNISQKNPIPKMIRNFTYLKKKFFFNLTPENFKVTWDSENEINFKDYIKEIALK